MCSLTPLRLEFICRIHSVLSDEEFQNPLGIEFIKRNDLRSAACHQTKTEMRRRRSSVGPLPGRLKLFSVIDCSKLVCSFLRRKRCLMIRFVRALHDCNGMGMPSFSWLVGVIITTRREGAPWS